MRSGVKESSATSFWLNLSTAYFWAFLCKICTSASIKWSPVGLEWTKFARTPLGELMLPRLWFDTPSPFSTLDCFPPVHTCRQSNVNTDLLTRRHKKKHQWHFLLPALSPNCKAAFLTVDQSLHALKRSSFAQHARDRQLWRVLINTQWQKFNLSLSTSSIEAFPLFLFYEMSSILNYRIRGASILVPSVQHSRVKTRPASRCAVKNVTPLEAKMTASRPQVDLSKFKQLDLTWHSHVTCVDFKRPRSLQH